MTGQEWAEILVPLIVFSALVALMALILLYKYKKKRLFLQMIERSLQRQALLPPEAIREIALHFFSANRDLRKGIFCWYSVPASWHFLTSPTLRKVAIWI